MQKSSLRKFLFGLVMTVTICSSRTLIMAAEHGGKEHGGKEHSEKDAAQAPSADEIRTTINNYVKAQSKKTKTFDLQDPETGTLRKLTFLRVHKRVGKTGDKYYSCADFKDTKSKELLDLDFDVDYKEGKLTVVDTRIHKVAGKERYTYDANDNRIPLGKEPGNPAAPKK